MESNNKEGSSVVHTKIRQDESDLWVRIIAFVFLVVMFIVDKVTQNVEPPLSDYWYIAVAVVAFFGTGVAKTLISKLK